MPPTRTLRGRLEADLEKITEIEDVKQPEPGSLKVSIYGVDGAGNSREMLTDPDGRQRTIARSRGAISLDDTVATDSQDLDVGSLSLSGNSNLDGARRLVSASIHFSSASDTTVRLVIENANDSNFDTVVREVNLNGDEDFFYTPDEDLRLSQNQNARLEADQETAGPTAYATLNMENI